MSNWKQFQQRFQPRLIMPGKAEHKLLSERMMGAADRAEDYGVSPTVVRMFARTVQDLERALLPNYYAHLVGGAVIGLLVGMILGVLLAGAK